MMIVKMINKSRIKTVIGSLFLTLCFTACSLNIPYENYCCPIKLDNNKNSVLDC